MCRCGAPCRGVHGQHVRASGGGDVNCPLAVSGLAGDLNVRLLAEQVAQPVPDDAVVVGDHHADGHEAGTRAVMVVPRPGALSTRRVPPSSAARSRMWVSPRPGCAAAAAYHFGDRASLLTVVATEGYRLLTEALRGA